MWSKRVGCGLLAVGALLAVNAGPAVAFNVPSTGGETAVTNLPSIDKSWGSPIMIPRRLPPSDNRVGYATDHPYSPEAPFGIFLSYFPSHVPSATAHLPVVQVWAWDDTSVRHMLGVVVAERKAENKIGGSATVRSFTAGRYQGKVVQEIDYAGSGNDTYIWHYSGVTHLLGFVTNKGVPYLGGLSPSSLIASFRYP